METRLATKADASALALMHAESFGDACWSRHQIAGSLSLETTLALIVVSEGAAQGFILCQITGPDAEILTLCISPMKRRRGLGLQLLNKSIEEAKKRGATRLFLEVAADNAEALGLYAKAAFSENGRRNGYYKREGNAVDAVRMERAL